MPPPPVKPDDGLQSFLEGFPFDEYSKLQQLLTTFDLTNISQQPSPPWRPFRPVVEPTDWLPPERRTDSTTLSSVVYNRLVALLQQLFPTDFPTRF